MEVRGSTFTRASCAMLGLTTKNTNRRSLRSPPIGKNKWNDFAPATLHPMKRCSSGGTRISWGCARGLSNFPVWDSPAHRLRPSFPRAPEASDLVEERRQRKAYRETRSHAARVFLFAAARHKQYRQGRRKGMNLLRDRRPSISIIEMSLIIKSIAPGSREMPRSPRGPIRR